MAINPPAGGAPSGAPAGGQPSGDGQPPVGDGQPTGGQPTGDGQPPADVPPSGNDDLSFRYSDNTPMSEFLKEYPQYSENPNFNKYKTVKAFAEGHESLISKLGTTVELPGEDATPEQLSEFYNKLGRPETPDKYEFEDKLPEGWTISEALDTEYRGLAHEIGLTPKQAQQLRTFYNTAVETAHTNNSKEVQTRLAQDHEVNVEKIKEIWGADYKAKTRIAMNTAKGILSQDTLDYLDATGLGNSATFVKDFYELSKRFSGDGPPIDNGGTPPQPRTLEIMESEAMQILRTPGWENDPELKRKYGELTQQRADILYQE